MPIRPAIFDGYIPTLHIATFFQALQDRRWVICIGRTRQEKADHWQRLLRTCHEWPRRYAPEPSNEFPPFHSITSSASATKFGGMLRPSALAVFILMTNSNLVGCITGRSAGFSPLRMRPVYAPTWRKVSLRSGP